jgi:toxin-antitoxin system PIN domain toxin
VFVVDTNLLLHAVNPDSPDHELALESLEEWRRGGRPWFVTWGIIYEFLRVSTHRSIFPQPLRLGEARAWIDTLVAAPAAGLLVETDRHPEVIRELTELHPRLAGNVVHDLHTVALMREHGVSEICTADTDFHQFGFLTVVNPLVPG